jgi:hypothetical protein
MEWDAIARDLTEQGYARLPALLDGAACREVAGWYDRGNMFRSRIVMARHGFGRGEYQYFADPLPPPVAALRRDLYAGLVPTARAWTGRDLPATHGEYRAVCARAGQTRPTPLLLRYGAGDFNCLHQDLYGAEHFPIQVAILLDVPGTDFTGGEFVLTTQRPRLQSRVDVVALGQGDGVAFAVNRRPVQGARGRYQVTMRHGVSPVRSGRRHTLGIIFHDAASPAGA